MLSFTFSFQIDEDEVPIYHFKILVPAAAVGAIMGKGGETILQLQKDAGAKIKMSRSQDFYPGNQFFFKLLLLI